MPRIRAGIITAVLQFVAGAGGRPARVRIAAGLRDGDLLDPDRMLDIDRLAATLDAAAEELSLETFGLRLGSHFDLEGLGLLTYAVLNADTVETGVKNLVRYLGTLIEGIQARLVVDPETVTLSVSLSDVPVERARQLQEGGVLVLLRMLRRLVGDDAWTPQAVAFAHAAPADTAEHRRVFGGEPLFDASANEIRFAPKVLGVSVPDADRSRLPVVEQRLREVLRDEPEDEPWLAELRVQIAGRLCDGHPSLVDLAPRVGMSARTLQRRLAERNIVYRDLVQEARRRLALRYLERGDTDLTEIAFLLGYSELSAFAHAFRRWTGRSPGAYRRAASG